MNDIASSKFVQEKPLVENHAENDLPRSRYRIWPVFVSIVVIVLLTAGFLKLHLLITDRFADLKTGYSLFWLWCAVLVELGVAAFVVGYRSDRHQWWALLALFSTLLIVASIGVWNGRQSCGCTGAIEISPLVFAVFDLVVIASLVLLRPVEIWQPLFKVREVSPATWGKVLGCVLAVGGFLAFQSNQLPAPIASLLGRPPIADIRIDLGDRVGLAAFDQPVTLLNPTDLDVRVVGITKSCNCLALNDSSKKLLIPPNGDLEIQLQVHPKMLGRFHHRVVFYLDSPQQFSVAVDLLGFYGVSVMKEFLLSSFKSALLVGCLLGSLLCAKQAFADDPSGTLPVCSGTWPNCDHKFPWCSTSVPKCPDGANGRCSCN
ncbi:MAG: hypothetical protein R3C03_20035 [Pirellulaceae bacterium]